MAHDDVRRFVIEALEQMNYDVADVDGDTPLGPAGVDLESLAVAELAVRVEEEYGVRFSEDEAEEMAVMTVGEFADAVSARRDLAKTAGQAE